MDSVRGTSEKRFACMIGQKDLSHQILRPAKQEPDVFAYRSAFEWADPATTIGNRMRQRRSSVCKSRKDPRDNTRSSTRRRRCRNAIDHDVQLAGWNNIDLLRGNEPVATLCASR